MLIEAQSSPIHDNGSAGDGAAVDPENADSPAML
jgi:hypothetical protein